MATLSPPYCRAGGCGKYVCGSLAGGAGNSCKTNLRTGVGQDFATGQKGIDVIAPAA